MRARVDPGQTGQRDDAARASARLPMFPETGPRVPLLELADVRGGPNHGSTSGRRAAFPGASPWLSSGPRCGQRSGPSGLDTALRGPHAPAHHRSYAGRSRLRGSVRTRWCHWPPRAAGRRWTGRLRWCTQSGVESYAFLRHRGAEIRNEAAELPARHGLASFGGLPRTVPAPGT